MGLKCGLPWHPCASPEKMAIKTEEEEAVDSGEDAGVLLSDATSTISIALLVTTTKLVNRKPTAG